MEQSHNLIHIPPLILEAAILLVTYRVGPATHVEDMAIPTTGAILIRTTDGIIVVIQNARMTMTMACVVKVASLGHSVVILVRKLPAETLAFLRMHVAATAVITIGAILKLAGIIAVIQIPHVMVV
ncbi:hypothetical protein CHS0354_007137 [Potamilus streckersoni]|uniref:Uncharacterized protein n=1 Tax=Potamilus streckersoni TaxID=2493646 RepID=A0AAE0SMK8_9BIVA|nr:hypothetical protein CHS0354_007137 [Potamilus streckersoni]